ncbi:MAG TPA: tetrahydrofolate dehydrogenase/cyclohydrolase catalytic domain-containing protein, partial [Bacteroidales bacterium]|nr:tetrahydrofolate dehydrogenase/cyclohydrolase catalytic domain-containing protein [Bacteroidales bacterium]
MYTLIDGKQTAADIRREIADEVASKRKSGLAVPHLAAILVGDDPSSQTYVNNKVKDCEEVGFRSTLITFGNDVPEKTLLAAIDDLNRDSAIDGFIVQLPLPGHITETKVIEAIDPSKDADGFHPVNLGKMMIGLDGFLPATPYGIMEL